MYVVFMSALIEEFLRNKNDLLNILWQLNNFELIIIVINNIIIIIDIGIGR